MALPPPDPTRAAGLRCLADFVPRAGPAYAAGRNADPGPEARGAVSRLSPYLRYRLVTEAETVAAVLARHSPSAAEKFVQEVLWRTYWKGWLEMRPSIWSRYLDEVNHQRGTFPNQRAIAAAEGGMTGIDGFDDWARELVATGYLHNHARMWFASIWVFTLRLPWTIGADFFLRHLRDADAASNTLSWRWVAGLQNVGKTYLATADNIARYTDGRFSPKGLATEAVALSEAPIPAPRALPEPLPPAANTPALLLVTPEDLHPESALPATLPIKRVIVAADPGLLWGDAARGFVASAAADAAARLGTSGAGPVAVTATLDLPTLMAAAQAAGVRQIVTPYAPVGPVADRLAALGAALAAEGIALHAVRRTWDAQFWPHAKKGFFAFKERIPALLREQGLG